MPLTEPDFTIRRIWKSTETQTVNNSTVLVDDDSLFLPLDTGTTYTIKGVLFVTSNSAADFKCTFTEITGADFQIFRIGTANNNPVDNFGDTSSNVTTTGQKVAIRIIGSLKMPNNADILQLEWAQNTAHASDTTVHIGSWLEITPCF